MGEPILIYGKSGCGKSHSLKNFGDDEIFLINTMGKRLPFPKKFKYEMKTRNIAALRQGLLKMPCKAAVIDDAGYLMTSTFMAGHSAPKTGSSTFELFNQIADEFWSLIIDIREKLPDDIFVYVIMHEQTSDYGETRARTIGKLLDEKVCVEGLFTICLHAMTDGIRYFFKTQGGANDIAKSPDGMFTPEIENDLKTVDTRIREFYEIGG